jgi:hypothetical protein
MQPEELLQIVRSRPFKPFRIHVTGGGVSEIKHPELIKVGRTMAVIFFPAADQPEDVFDRYDPVPLDKIERIELITPSAR